MRSCPTLQPHGTHRAPLSIGLPRQEYWSELPFPSPGAFPDPGIKPTSALAGRFFTTKPQKLPNWLGKQNIVIAPNTVLAGENEDNSFNWSFYIEPL